MPTRRRGPALAAALALLLGACAGRAAGGDTVASPRADDAPGLAVSDTLTAAAAVRAEDLCDRRSVADDPTAAARYDQESWSDVRELVGRAPVPAPGDAEARRRARAEVEAAWGGRRTLTDHRWDRIGTGEVVCGDDHLYVVTALARAPRVDDAGPYAAIGVDRAALTVHEGVRYGTAPAVDGRPTDLLLDVVAPPVLRTGGRPAVVLVHGGGFAAGSRAMHADDALAYARRGWVAVTIDYRLDPGAGTSTTAHRAAANAALADARRAVAWLRDHAATYGIDPDRIAALGASAGGEIALGLALLEAPGPDGATTTPIAAAASTGAYLTPVLGGTRLDADDAPVLLQFFEQDTVNGRRWTFAGATCEAVRAAGATCDLLVSPGAGHTVDLGPKGPLGDALTAFLALHLDLG